MRLNWKGQGTQIHGQYVLRWEMGKNYMVYFLWSFKTNQMLLLLVVPT